MQVSHQMRKEDGRMNSCHQRLRILSLLHEKAERFEKILRSVSGKIPVELELSCVRRIILHHYGGYRIFVASFHVIIEIRIHTGNPDISSIKKIHVSLFFQDFFLKSHDCGPVISEDFSVLFLHRRQ
jgi:hypothetical protein